MNIIFTNHAREKLQRRKISEEEAIEAIHFPNKIEKKHGKYFFQKQLERGTIEVVCERTEKHINIITICWV